ncbi:MAG: hypothetical protein K8S15_11380 [Candidatus Aegiribacteria sp.]|nr:hypothetical protein [Candidatus Aegiribacteria sp.]
MKLDISYHKIGSRSCQLPEPFSPDFCVEERTGTTICGYHEPTLELHYTIRY